MADQDIDRLFQEGMEGRSFTWDESYWNAMEKELDQKKKKRRGFFFLLFGVGAIVLGGLIFMPFLKTNEVITDVNDNLPSTKEEAILPTQNTGRSDVSALNTDVQDVSIPELKKASPIQPATIPTTTDTGTAEDNETVSAKGIPVVIIDREEQFIQEGAFEEQEEDEEVEVEDVWIASEETERIQMTEAEALVILDIRPEREGSFPKPSEAVWNDPGVFRWGVGGAGFFQSAIPDNWQTTWVSGWKLHGSFAFVTGNRLMVRIEPGVTTYRGDFEMLESVTHRSFDLGLMEQTYRMIPESMVYGSLPIQATLRTNGRHHLSLGFETAYLIGVRGRIEQWDYLAPEDRTAAQAGEFEEQWRRAKESGTDPLPSFEVLTGTQTGWLATEVINKFSAAIRAGYELDISPELRMSFLGRYRVSRFGTDVAISSNQSRLSLEVGLNYWIR